MREPTNPRRPTVASPRWRGTRNRPSPHASLRRSSSPILAWLKRESVAVLALSGAALTVLAELAKAMPFAPPFSLVLMRWREFTNDLWRPPLDLAGIDVHQDIVAALSVSAFMVLLGIGARLSARLSGQPLAPMSLGRFFDDQTWPSLIVFAALCLVFLLGHGDADRSDVLTFMGSEEAGKYGFAVLVTAGYFAGDFIGHRQFHLRLYRLAWIVAAISAANLAMIHFGSAS